MRSDHGDSTSEVRGGATPPITSRFYGGHSGGITRVDLGTKEGVVEASKGVASTRLCGQGDRRHAGRHNQDTTSPEVVCVGCACSMGTRPIHGRYGAMTGWTQDGVVGKDKAFIAAPKVL